MSALQEIRNRIAIGQFSELTDERLTFAEQLGVSGVQHNTPAISGERGYWEYSEYGKKWRGVGSIAYRPAERFHRIELDNNKPVWTLCFVGPFKRNWNFLKGDKIVSGDKSYTSWNL